MYGAGEYDLAGFAVGAVERSEVLDGLRIEAGHRLLGLGSSGPHSNGYSLIRKIIELSGADLQEPLEDSAGDPVPLGEALLAPTRIYVKPVLELLRRGGIDGLAHITGGGLTENVVRAVPEALGIDVDTSAWPRPAVFRWLQEHGAIEEKEMLRTFNCGIGMVLLTPADAASEVAAAARELGVDCFDVGAVTERRGDKRVRYLP
jgi:phosphoribosylformylglycinamidine cyclo-ligase